MKYISGLNGDPKPEQKETTSSTTMDPTKTPKSFASGIFIFGAMVFMCFSYCQILFNFLFV